MILVVGIPRSRTSLLMQTLNLLGLSVIGRFERNPENLRGNGECLETSAGVDTAKHPENAAMKVMVDAFLFRSKIQPTDKIIYALRPPEAVSWSQGQMGAWRLPPDERRWNYWRLTKQFLLWKEEHKTPILMVPTDDLIERPKAWVATIAAFVGVPLTEVAVQNVSNHLTTLKPGGEAIEDDATAAYKEALLCTATT